MEKLNLRKKAYYRIGQVNLPGSLHILIGSSGGKRLQNEGWEQILGTVLKLGRLETLYIGELTIRAALLGLWGLRQEKTL